MFAAGRQPAVQLEAACGAGRSDARLDSQRVERDQHDRAIKLLSQPRRHDADHAGMPTTFGQNQGRVALGVELFGGLLVGGQIDAALEALAAAVQFVQVSRQRLGPLSRIGGQQLDAQRGLTQATGRVEPGG